MLKTVTGINSLLLWNQNANHSNILQESNSTVLDDKVKELVTDFFEDLYKTVTTCNITKFSTLWVQSCNKLNKKVVNDIRRYCQSKFTSVGEEALNKVADKVRGNVGEIFAEQFFKSFGDEYDCDSDAYQPVDPHCEFKLDAQSCSSINKNIPIGIQIKNWSNPITNDIFISASYEDIVAFRSINPEYQREYLIKPRQYVFSFTEAKDNLWLDNERNAGIVQFIGPKDIDKHSQNIQVLLKKIINSLN